jgi:hypothetical protein
LTDDPLVASDGLLELELAPLALTRLRTHLRTKMLSALVEQISVQRCSQLWSSTPVLVDARTNFEALTRASIT